MHNFSPFSVKLHTYIRFGEWQGGSAPLPRKICFGGLNLPNFRPFFSATFYKDIGILGGGLKDTPAPPHSKY